MEVQKGIVPPEPGLPKFKVFNFLSWKHELFNTSKYKRKIKLSASERWMMFGHFFFGLHLISGKKTLQFLVKAFFLSLLGLLT